MVFNAKENHKQGETIMKRTLLAASMAAMIFTPSTHGASSAEATFDKFLSRSRTIEVSNVLAAFSSRKPQGFIFTIR